MQMKKIFVHNRHDRLKGYREPVLLSVTLVLTLRHREALVTHGVWWPHQPARGRGVWPRLHPLTGHQHEQQGPPPGHPVLDWVTVIHQHSHALHSGKLRGQLVLIQRAHHIMQSRLLFTTNMCAHIVQSGLLFTSQHEDIPDSMVTTWSHTVLCITPHAQHR